MFFQSDLDPFATEPGVNLFLSADIILYILAMSPLTNSIDAMQNQVKTYQNQFKNCNDAVPDKYIQNKRLDTDGFGR